jgi:hypothetical protein
VTLALSGDDALGDALYAFRILDGRAAVLLNDERHGIKSIGGRVEGTRDLCRAGKQYGKREQAHARQGLVGDAMRCLPLQPLVKLIELRRPGAPAAEVLAELVGVRQARAEDSGQHAEATRRAGGRCADGDAHQSDDAVALGDGQWQRPGDAPVRQVVHGQMARKTRNERLPERESTADGGAGEHVVRDEHCFAPGQGDTPVFP